MDGVDLRAIFVAGCLRGALPPIDLWAIFLVRAMVGQLMYEYFLTQLSNMIITVDFLYSLKKNGRFGISFSTCFNVYGYGYD